jgi:hypothetical protein
VASPCLTAPLPLLYSPLCHPLNDEQPCHRSPLPAPLFLHQRSSCDTLRTPPLQLVHATVRSHRRSHRKLPLSSVLPPPLTVSLPLQSSSLPLSTLLTFCEPPHVAGPRRQPLERCFCRRAAPLEPLLRLTIAGPLWLALVYMSMPHNIGAQSTAASAPHQPAFHRQPRHHHGHDRSDYSPTHIA